MSRRRRRAYSNGRVVVGRTRVRIGATASIFVLPSPRSRPCTRRDARRSRILRAVGGPARSDRTPLIRVIPTAHSRSIRDIPVVRRGTVAAYSPRGAGETPIKLAHDPYGPREARQSWSSHFGNARGRITVKFVGGDRHGGVELRPNERFRDRAQASREGPMDARCDLRPHAGTPRCFRASGTRTCTPKP